MSQRPHRTTREHLPAGAALLVALVLGVAAARADEPAKAPEKAPEKATPQPAAKPVQDPLLIGEYSVSPEQVVDGDTLRLPDGQGSIRILGLDTEETFKNERERKAAEADFAAYAKAQRGSDPRPVKYGTPAGEAAGAYLRNLVKGCTTMRLERDGVGARDRGTYGRILAHVFLQKADGTRINVAEALIRAGHSLYFVKYGRSLRFHGLFHLAQAEARKAERGIWAKDGPHHYPDYTERLLWWKARSAQVVRWRALASRPDHVTLGQPDADTKLAALVGKDAVVFGLFDRELKVKSGDKRIFLLSHERRRGFPLVFFDLEQAQTLAAREPFHSMYVTVRGKVTLYQGRPQMVLESAAQVSTQ
jgi:endonuclease YncB( thermonuclease family)